MLTRWASKGDTMSKVSSGGHWVRRPSMTASRLAATWPASGPGGRAPVPRPKSSSPLADLPQGAGPEAALGEDGPRGVDDGALSLPAGRVRPARAAWPRSDMGSGTWAVAVTPSSVVVGCPPILGTVARGSSGHQPAEARSGAPGGRTGQA